MKNYFYKDGYVIVQAMHAKDWSKAIGESLYLSAFTDRKPGVLLVTRPDDTLLLQAKMACDRGRVKLWIVTVD